MESGEAEEYNSNTTICSCARSRQVFDLQLSDINEHRGPGRVSYMFVYVYINASATTAVAFPDERS